MACWRARAAIQMSLAGDGAALALEWLFDVDVLLKGLTIREQESDA